MAAVPAVIPDLGFGWSSPSSEWRMAARRRWGTLSGAGPLDAAPRRGVPGASRQPSAANPPPWTEISVSTIALVDVLGFTAALLTLVAFSQRRMLPMRMAAIAANLFFIGYAAIGAHPPVLALHAVLLPVNLLRMASDLAGARGAAPGEEGAREAAGIMGWV